MKELNDKNFSKEVLENVSSVLVKFSSPTCRPCQMMIPILKEIEEKYAEKLIVAEVNIIDSLPLAQTYQIMSVPTLILFKNGKVVKQFIGYLDADDFENEFGSFL